MSPVRNMKTVAASISDFFSLYRRPARAVEEVALPRDELEALPSPRDDLPVHEEARAQEPRPRQGLLHRPDLRRQGHARRQAGEGAKLPEAGHLPRGGYVFKIY